MEKARQVFRTRTQKHQYLRTQTMRAVISGNGTDSTSQVVAWLQAGQEFRFANLYLIGEVEDPASVWLTDWDTALAWPVWTDEKRSTLGAPKAFDPAVITR